mgnify:CR=1 FL=1
MTRRRSPTKIRWVTCFTSWSLVGLLACVGSGEISLGFNGQTELEYLRNTKTRLTPYSADSIDELRAHLVQYEAEGSPTPPRPPVGWTMQTTRSGSGASGRVSYHFDRSELPWVQLVDFIDQLETHFSIQSLDIRSRGSLTQRDITQVDITVVVPIETTRRQAATTFPGWEDTARSRQDGSIRPFADRSSTPDQSAARLRLPVRPPFRFVPSLRLFAGQGSFILPALGIPSLDILSQGGLLTHREIARVDTTVAVPIETTRRQAATTFPGPEVAARRRKHGSPRHFADRASTPDQSAARLRLPVRTAFRFVPSLRRSAAEDLFIQPSFRFTTKSFPS